MGQVLVGQLELAVDAGLQRLELGVELRILGVVDGVECEHLAFRTPDTDWQIWIETGDRPVPHKYVITSKTLAGAPQYTLRIKDWKTDPIADADAFTFKAPEGATKASLDSEVMIELDEVPPGTTEGAKK